MAAQYVTVGLVPAGRSLATNSALQVIATVGFTPAGRSLVTMSSTPSIMALPGQADKPDGEW